MSYPPEKVERVIRALEEASSAVGSLPGLIGQISHHDLVAEASRYRRLVVAFTPDEDES